MTPSASIASLALRQFRQDWPLLAHRLDSMRLRVDGGAVKERGTSDASRAAVRSIPDGNNGDNSFSTGAAR